MMINKRILLVSDINNYPNEIKNAFWEQNQVDHFSSLNLSGIPSNIVTKEERHRFMIEKGIENSVSRLKSILGNQYDLAVGYSIGGLILWKLLLKNCIADQLVCLSSTRLRLENDKPNTNIQLFYGAKDDYKPENNWFEKMKIKPVILKNEEHEFYKKHEVENQCFELF